MQVIELVTRKIDPRGAEMVVGVRINGEEAVVPLGSKIRVEAEAGESLTTVTIEMFADRVRYVTEEQAALERHLAPTDEAPDGDAPAT